ncbi:MAG: C-GCAxxG-C-C family protein [Clostridiales Family XIII bacterium]|jgi:C_GCAxxG_C_C family probable redox protein|nr:C-GCAxxG-C-C family protein [Clostridiales Family XIII bacterium]
MTREETVKGAARRIEHYRAQGYACSEASIRALADLFDCPLPQDVIKAAGVFAGGAAVDGRCGIGESALIFVAYLFGGKAGAHRLPERARRVQREMENALGSIMCSDLFYPLYEEHRSKGEPEEAFHCVFDSGIVCVAGTIHDMIYET